VRRAIEALRVPVRDDAEVFATVSAGVASYPTAARDETELIERSDAALYESKRRGRNRVTVFDGSREGGLETSNSA
jgi:diguanylate cyclase (GGDEF)-like protein